MGICLVKELLAKGNRVTIATRGNAPDTFGMHVNRIKMDVTNGESVRNALQGKVFDVVFDNLAYCSENVNNILSNVKCKRYIQLSSVEAYEKLICDMHEEHFNPYSFPVELCTQSVGYVKGKQSAETIVYKKFPEVSAVTVRIPYVTPTDRIYYYCQHIVQQIPMSIEDTSKGFTLIRDTEVGRFLPWIAAQDFEGPINLASEGMVTVQMMLHYIEDKVGRKAILDEGKGDTAPFNVYNENTFSMNMDKAKRLGYHASGIHDWFWKLLDEYIARAMRENEEKDMAAT